MFDVFGMDVSATGRTRIALQGVGLDAQDRERTDIVNHQERRTLIYRPIFHPHSQCPEAYFGVTKVETAYRWAGVQVGILYYTGPAGGGVQHLPMKGAYLGTDAF